MRNCDDWLTAVKEIEMWSDIEFKFPLFIAEMKADFADNNYNNVRKFYIKSSKTVVTSCEPILEYHTDIHTDLSVAMRYLEKADLVEDVSGNNTIFRFPDRFVNYLRGYY